jgi:RNA polymerase sigma-70 factor (ECF subfamily)
MSDTRSDAELVQKLQKRDPDGLADVYDQHAQLVYSLFLRITRDETAAEDLVQELFMRVWNRAKEFDQQRGALGVWIVSIARNMAIDHVRSAHARFAQRVRPLEYVDWEKVEGGSRPDSALHNSQLVKTAFGYLNENQKRALELAYFEGCSQSEIARRLQEPLGTVKSWIRSGLMKLRSAMEGGDVA